MAKKSEDKVEHNISEGYVDTLTYLEDEFIKLDLILKYLIVVENSESSEVSTQYADFYISREKILSYLNGSSATVDSTVLSNSLDLKQQINEMESRISSKAEFTRNNGNYSRIDYLRSPFTLSSLEIQILIIALAPLIDSKYEQIYGYLQDSSLQKNPSLQLLYRLFGSNLADIAVIRELISPHSSLIFWGLIEFIGHPDEEGASRNFKIDPRIADYILGSDLLDSSVIQATSVLQPLPEGTELLFEKQLLEEINVALKLYQKGESNNIRKKTDYIVFRGEGSYDKECAARFLSRNLGMPLLFADSLAFPSDTTLRQWLKRLIRETLLYNTILMIRVSSDKTLINDITSILNSLEPYTESPIILDIPSEVDSNTIIAGPTTLFIEFVKPRFELKKKIWKKHINGFKIGTVPGISEKLSEMFEFSSDQIQHAITVAKNRQLIENGSEDITYESLVEASRDQSKHGLGNLGIKLTGKYSFEDIVLPDSQLKLLQEVLIHSQYRRQVFIDWGFQEKIRYGQGLSILFYGESGTGKTMAASIVASELDLDIYRIDLSGIVSKYIGETEKNLAKVFDEARKTNSILFFDEADALFGKRTDVKDAHDRYANIEVSYLLQKMEEYDGVSILATNLKDNIDDAFTRRIRFMVEFPFPEEKYRKKIWAKIFPEKAPLNEKMDYDFLAQKMDVTGGLIKNIALSAAFIASSEQQSISMNHIVLAARREYKKTAKSFSEAEMRPFLSQGNLK